MPQIAVHIVPSAEAPTGMGKPGLPPLAPVFANAIARLAGKPFRQLPFNLASACKQAVRGTLVWRTALDRRAARSGDRFRADERMSPSGRKRPSNVTAAAIEAASQRDGMT